MRLMRLKSHVFLSGFLVVTGMAATMGLSCQAAAGDSMPAHGALAGERPRVIVSTDIGGSDNDDYQSMVHFLLYADVFDVEGLLSSPPGGGRAANLHEVVEAYERDFPCLRLGSSDYPAPGQLRALVKQGAMDPAPPAGFSAPTEGSRWLIKRALATEDRPLYVLVWGSITDVAQAVHDEPVIKKRLRVYSIGSWNTRQDPAAHDYLFQHHSDLWWIEADTTFRGMYVGGLQEGDLGNQSFLDNHVRNCGALGRFLVSKLPAIKMGDTPSALYLLRGDAGDPVGEHWGGRFVATGHGPHYWTDSPDPALAEKSYPGAKTVNVWREEYLRDWQSRMLRTAPAREKALPSTTEACAPYPPSPVIERIEFDFASCDRRAPGSDNWPLTWAADGHQYTSWGDGGGFGGTNEQGRVSLGVARIEGNAGDYRGVNVWGGKDTLSSTSFGGKSYGILALHDTLYMWISPGSGEENNQEARLAWSLDQGLSWQRASWAFTQEDQIMVPTFCQFGRAYEGARDGYVYLYSTRLLDPYMRMQRPGLVDLLRAPQDKLRERDAYEVFAGLNGEGMPQWSSAVSDRCAVMEDVSGTHRLSVSYDRGLRRYLMCIEHSETNAGNLAIFDAPDPWGPWTTVEYMTNWGGFGSTFFWCIPTKWLSDDGAAFTMVFTGTGKNDAWNTLRGRFILYKRQAGK